MTPQLPAAWTLAASAFNWTPDVIRAERTAPEIAVGIVTEGIATVIELEPDNCRARSPTLPMPRSTRCGATSTRPAAA